MPTVAAACAAVLVAMMAAAAVAGQTTSPELQYVVAEERPLGSTVADLVADARLRQTLDGAVVDVLVFDVFHGPHSELFDVDSPSGIVRVKRALDRDVVCYKLPVCVIALDVAIVRPSTHFQVHCC